MLAPQTVLQNRYLVVKQIGQGGMGAVYLATDQRFGSTVALKETFFEDAPLRKAFEREARLLNSLRHPALPNVSDHFTEDEGQFLVMEYIAGEDFSEMLKQQGGAFPIKETLGWADQLLDALDYLHTQESPVIHRDIKPQNLKLTPRGQIILLDFGLAKGSPQQASQVTHSRSVFGYSRNYAPLEQIQGTGTDPRSDLYSLAATLYHLMTGIAPPDALTRASAVLNAQPDPLKPANEANNQVPLAVARVLTDAMSLNAGQRPMSAAAMRSALVEAGKATLVVGGETTAQVGTANTLLEQDTQLISTPRVGPLTSANAPNEKDGSGAGIDLATSVDAGAATDRVATPAMTHTEDSESDLTRLTEKPAAGRSLSGRAMWIATGAVILIVASAVIFTMTRQSADSGKTTSQETTSVPAVSSSVSPQPRATQSSTSENALPSRTPETSPQELEPSTLPPNPPGTPSRSNNAPTTTTKSTNTSRNDQANSNAVRNNDNRNLSEAQIAEERRQALLEQRRAAAERQRAERRRRNIEAFRRRQLGGRP